MAAPMLLMSCTSKSCTRPNVTEQPARPARRAPAPGRLPPLWPSTGPWGCAWRRIPVVCGIAVLLRKMAAGQRHGAFPPYRTLQNAAASPSVSAIVEHAPYTPANGTPSSRIVVAGRTLGLQISLAKAISTFVRGVSALRGRVPPPCAAKCFRPVSQFSQPCSPKPASWVTKSKAEASGPSLSLLPPAAAQAATVGGASNSGGITLSYHVSPHLSQQPVDDTPHKAGQRAKGDDRPGDAKIFAPTPVTQPSALNSIAGLTTELANPVMGTSVPAPALAASF